MSNNKPEKQNQNGRVIITDSYVHCIRYKLALRNTFEQ